MSDLPPGADPIPSGIPTSTCTNPTTFRQHFPSFVSATYPDSQVQFWLDVGSVMCNPGVWGAAQQQGAELICAHFLALGQMAAQGGSAGGVPGMASGLVTNKSVSKVSVGRDVNVTAMEGAGPFNYTTYGQQYYYLMLLAGTGGYETLSVAYSDSMVGIVNTWARGVMLSYGS
jgi:hypothetical protein